MAEEVHYIYPEGEWALNRIKDEPAHLLFKSFGEQMPEGDWNDPGTKQGIYMMGPEGEYLEGAHAASGSGSKLAERMERALVRWKELKKSKDYAAKKIPPVAAVAPPEIAEAPLALRVSLRDVPRGQDDDSGRRRTQKDLEGRGWMSFVEWAWNQNWLTIEDPALLVPDSKDWEPVAEAAAQHIVRDALVDNVRGQNPPWTSEDIKSMEFQMRLVSKKGMTSKIEYSGSAVMDAGTKRFAPTIYGTGEWDGKGKRFTELTLVAVGERAGAANYNQRGEDKDPAPMGVLLELFTPKRGGAHR